MFASMRTPSGASRTPSGVPDGAGTARLALSVRGLACAGGLLWGGCLLVVGTCHHIWPTYGTAFLDVLRSVYPGYGAATGSLGVLLGTVYGAVDGAVAGALAAWLYNAVAAPAERTMRDDGKSAP